MTADTRLHLLLRLTRVYEHWVLGAMLLLLHVAIWWDFGSALSASLMLAHLGLFLLWQPLVRGDQRLDLPGMVVFVLFTLGFVASLNWWLLIGWLLLLIGLVGGRSSTGDVERYAYMLTLAFLVSELIIRCIPELFYARGLSQSVVALFQYGLLAIPLLLSVMPVPDTVRRARPPIDLFRGMTASLMTALVILGSLVNMYRTASEYPVALFQSLLALAAFLFAISWLITPRAGRGGLAQLWERSLLNIGTPFEEWIAELARLADSKQTPRQFLDAAMTAMVTLPWVHGLRWRSGDSTGEQGLRTRYVMDLSTNGIDVQLYTHRPAGATLLLHGKLLVQLLGYFHTAKLRESELAKQAHMQAIYETGARVTHDIKNLLQSLQAITLALAYDRQSVPDVERRRQDARGRQLLEKQLPLISQRLQLALDKLQSPDKATAELKPLAQWWEQIKARNQHGDVDFRASALPDLLIPADLFDSVAENLLENARNKQLLEPGLRITVDLKATDSSTTLRVIDTGTPIPPDKSELMFRQPLDSSVGLGIGLYQAARQAEMLGYTLRLAQNDLGNVCFELANQPASGSSQYSLFTPP